ncbi:MAG: GGDEF domain-containing protein, partial [Desulfobacterota bacterium]|nr:GGDEF domain-containing protein [Thermodesulfobacteriota bacterium]
PFIKNLIYAYRRIRGSDHKVLNRYILAIQQSKDIEAIVCWAFAYLRQAMDITGCACAVYDREYNGGIDIWSTPQVDTLRLTRFVKRDFDIPNAYYNVHYPEQSGRQERCSACACTGDMLSYGVDVGQIRARLYVVPVRSLRAYQAELIVVLLQAVSTAIVQCIRSKRLEDAALIDPLTHCYNRRALEDVLAQAIAQAQRYQNDLALIIFDIDYFKKVNDRYGHRVGDAVLKAVAKTILAAIRKSDCLTRYGGEEFVLVLPETKLSKAIELAERLRRAIEKTRVECDNDSIAVTASFGVAAFKPGMDQEQLLTKADEMLYEAKRQGRNRIAPDLKVYTTLQAPSFATDSTLQ